MCRWPRVFFGAGDDPVGGLFIGLNRIYAADLISGFRPDRPGIRALGGRPWVSSTSPSDSGLTHLMFAVMLTGTEFLG